MTISLCLRSIIAMLSLVGLLLNLLLMCTMFLRRDNSFQNYRIYLAAGCFHAITYTVVTLLILPIHSISDGTVSITFGYLPLLPYPFIMFLYKLWVVLSFAQWFSLSTAVLYHYNVLCRPPLSPAVHVLLHFYLLSLLSPMTFSLFAWFIPSPAEYEETENNITMTSFNAISCLLVLVTPVCLSSLVLLLSLTKVVRHLRVNFKNKSTLKNKTAEMNAKVAMMIWWQVSSPIILAGLPLLFSALCILFSLPLGEFLSLGTVALSALPLSHAIILSYYVCPPSLIWKRKGTTSQSSKTGPPTIYQKTTKFVPPQSIPRSPLVPIKQTYRKISAY